MDALSGETVPQGEMSLRSKHGFKVISKQRFIALHDGSEESGHGKTSAPCRF